MIYIGLFLLGLAVGIGSCVLIYQPKLRQRYEQKEEIRLKEQELQEKIKKLDQEAWQLSEEVSKRTLEKQDLQLSILTAQTKREALIQNIKDIEEQAQITANAIYEKNYTQMSQAFEQSAEKMSDDFQSAREEWKEEYLSVISELTLSINDEIKEKKEELDLTKRILDELRLKVTAAVEASKRAAEITEQANFYKINLSNEDINEIKKLKEIIPYLKDQEALNKVIWKIYYEKPSSDLIGRVIGNDRKTGIYKITNLIDNKCYVGQAVDIAARWRQHIKRGLGAETAIRNKLYPAMMETGVENFSFEIIEECNSSLLDEREDFWQDYFHAKEYGYSIK